MQQYIKLVEDVLEHGTDKSDRTGIGSRSVFGRMMEFDLDDGFPAVTTRPAPFRIAFEETMFFLRGETDTKKLEDKNVKIWKGNTTREFLDNKGLTHLPEGDMGYGYGHQWRNFGGTGLINGIDQVSQLLADLEADPYSRRHIVTAWNPAQLDDMALPPCHLLHQYQVMDGKLNSSFYMRSNDVIYGLPFNIMSYAFLNMAFSKILGLTPGKLVYFGADVHIYNNQIEMAKEQIKRTPKKLPTLNFKKSFSTLDEMLLLTFDDIELVGYESYDDFKNKPQMAV